MSILSSLIQKRILKSFFQIELNQQEQKIAEYSILNKYVPALRGTILISLLVAPGILFLPTSTLATVFIPVTMVSGTAWFAISLANVRKKFEEFGLELTMQMFRSFLASLSILGLLVIFSLLQEYLLPIKYFIENQEFIKNTSIVLALIGVIWIFWDLFNSSLKYDVNDTMLTGQNETAEQFFQKSLFEKTLRFLHTAIENLRTGKNLELANYYIGVSFYEIFSFIKLAGGSESLSDLTKKALEIKHHPSLPQAEVDTISLELIEQFMNECKNIQGIESMKSFENIKDEFYSIKNNRDQSQAMIDTRFSIIFEEISMLLQLQGKELFKQIPKKI